jgi:uncharacterized HAD superfamily protein
MKIGVDIDDTLLHAFEDFLNFYNEQNKTSFQKENNTSDKKFHEFLGITKKELISWYIEYDKHDRSNNLHPIEGAKEVLKELVSKHEFVLITAREEFLAEKTKRIVDKHYSDFNFRIVFNKHGIKLDKGEICLREGVKIMIDDDIDNAFNCVSKGIKVIMLNKPWNRGRQHKDLIRVDNWGQVLEEIKKLEDSQEENTKA